MQVISHAFFSLPTRTKNVSIQNILVNESSTAELGIELSAKDLGESTLVVIVALGSRVINASDIDNNIACRQLGGVACADKGYSLVFYH